MECEILRRREIAPNLYTLLALARTGWARYFFALWGEGLYTVDSRRLEDWHFGGNEDMRYAMIAMVALLAVACGDVEDTNTAPELGAQTLDLRVTEAAHTVRVSAADNVSVIRRNGQVVSLGEWMDSVGRTHGIDMDNRLDPEGELTIVVTESGDFQRERKRPSDDGPLAGLEETEQEGACPENCVHCPEDSAFLCAQLCGY